jgi:hypothetical protein
VCVCVCVCARARVIESRQSKARCPHLRVNAHEKLRPVGVAPRVGHGEHVRLVVLQRKGLVVELPASGRLDAFAVRKWVELSGERV